MVTNFHAGCLIPTELLVRIAQRHFSASRSLPCARSKLNWTDDVTEISLTVKRFLNVRNIHQLDLVECK